jgi:hypothetical protein
VELGAFFILLVGAIIIGVGGFLLYGVAWKLRNEKLHPRRDKVDGRDEPSHEDSARPRHVRVGNEQRTRFITDR